jgi:cardiolipin synthase
LGDIAKARRQVHLEYYIFADDRTGQLRDALVERARAGVMVKVLLDAVGSSTLHASFFAPLVAAGGEFAWFHPTRLRLFTRPWVNLRCHRKIAIIDGHIGYTGGINVTDDENDALRDDAYRDLHMRLEGDIVRSLQLVFVEDWVYATGQKPGTFHVMDTWPASVPRRGDGHIQAQALVSGPDTSWEAIHRMQVAAIHEAKQRVWLVTPYFVPGEAARMALSSAALGGLDVRLLVPRMSDSRMVTLAARSYYAELLAAGADIEYGPRMLHTKALLTDDDLCMVAAQTSTSAASASISSCR